MPLNLSPIKCRVMPMPRTPVKSPSGIPAADTVSASKRTMLRICFFVAPTEANKPNWRVLSPVEMENAL